VEPSEPLNVQSKSLRGVAHGTGSARATSTAIVLLACGILTGCISESSGPDSACQWRRDSIGALDLTDPRQDLHLSNDAEEAEDLAIRYADGHSRPGTAAGHTMAEYTQTRDQCMAALFQVIADHHHVAQQQVREAINKHRHTSLDVAVMLSFGLLYGLFVNGFVRRIWCRFPPKQDRWLGIMATVVISPVVSLLGVFLGGMWTFWAETFRIGYGHVSDRAERIPWNHHQSEIFVTGLVVFWILSLVRYRYPGPVSGSGSRLGLLD
jgi:hypothetical protein